MQFQLRPYLIGIVNGIRVVGGRQPTVKSSSQNRLESYDMIVAADHSPNAETLG